MLLYCVRRDLSTFELTVEVENLQAFIDILLGQAIEGFLEINQENERFYLLLVCVVYEIQYVYNAVVYYIAGNIGLLLLPNYFTYQWPELLSNAT